MPDLPDPRTISNKRTSVEDALRDENPEALFADGFDEAILGILSLKGHPAVVVYDLEQVINTCVVDAGMTREEAEEYVQFNVTDAYVGENTPAFVSRPYDFPL